MSKPASISIITVSYNSAATIEDTLKSVTGQTYPHIEYIIVDGASKDDTLAICEKYRHGIAQIVSEKDKGIYDAMNKGLQLATGDYIGILNSDDVYADANVIADVVAMLEKTGAEALYADLVYVDRHNLHKVTRYWKSGGYARKKFKWGWMPPHPTVFMAKSLYEKHGLFNLSLRSAADYELMLRFFYKHAVSPVYLKRVITKMRVGGESNVTVKNRLKANGEDRTAWSINNLKPYWFTLSLKPLRKIPQFIFKKIRN